jgi:hypothetical protein
MTAIPLTAGAYSAQSLIANAQRCVNLYPEINPKNAEPNMPVTHYVVPGLGVLGAGPGAPAPGRCLYRSTRGTADPNGDLFAAVGQNIYFIDPDFKFNLLGSVQSAAPSTPVSMADNGTDILIVDNSAQGYQIHIATKAFTQIGDPNFLGSTRADFLDSFILLNVPGTNQWYCTTSDTIIPFNALYIGIKTAWPDNVMCVVAIEREAWVFGPQKSEPWYNAGAVPFPFQLLPGVIIEQGCQAVYSPAKMDTFVYWLAAAPEGGYMAMKGGAQNQAVRISTHAIEAEWKKYPRVDDAIGSVYQIEGHSFYYLHFPAADKTWGFDAATEQWHEKNWIDNNGVLHRSRDTFTAFAYGKNLALDWANGTLYEVSADILTDAGQPIPWIRSFPHIVNELKYVSHPVFMADVETGTRPGTGEAPQFLSPWSSGFSSGFGPLSQITVPVVNFRMSVDAGYHFGKLRPKRNISSGRNRPAMRWRGLGIARDAVFELSSTAEMCGALNGAYIDPIPATA